MKNPEDVGWDEFKDLDFANWKRIRAAIEHENQLTNQRITWLLGLNGSLIIAFGAILSKTTSSPIEKLALASLSICGITFSLVSASGLRAAHDQHDRVVAWWNEIRTRKGSDAHPRIAGDDPKVLFFRLHYHQFPHIFIVLWLALITTGLLNELRSVLPQILSLAQYLAYAIGLAGAIIGVFALGINWARSHPKK